MNCFLLRGRVVLKIRNIHLLSYHIKGKMTYRNPIARLGALDAKVELDVGFIEDSRESTTIYPSSSRDSDYNIRERQILIKKITAAGTDTGANLVIGHAGGLGKTLAAHFKPGELPDLLERELIMREYQCAGVSVTGYNMGSGPDGFVSTYAGTTTLTAHVNVRAGQTLIVDLPSRNELNAIKARTNSNAVPLIARPEDKREAGYKLRAAMKASILQPDPWNKLCANEDYVSVGVAAEYACDYAIMSGLAMVKMLYEAGIITLARNAQNQREWRGADRVRKEVTQLLARFPQISNDSTTQSGMSMQADALCQVLFRMFMGTRSSSMVVKEQYNALPARDKADMEQLRKAILLANCQDSEANTITAFAGIMNKEGNVLRMSTIFGYISETVDDKGREVIPAHHVVEKAREHGGDYNLISHDRPTCYELRAAQTKCLTKAMTAYNMVSKTQRREIGMALNSATAGGSFDVALHVKGQ